MPANANSRRRTAEGTVTLLKTRSTALLVRLRGDLSVRQAAALMDISKSHLSDIEQGKREPSYTIGLRIAAYYGVPMSALFDEVPLEYGEPVA